MSPCWHGNLCCSSSCAANQCQPVGLRLGSLHLSPLRCCDCVQVEGTDRKCGGLVRFTSGELAVQDAYSSMDQDGIEALQPFVDALLPAGQELRALVVEGLCGGYELSVDCSCRQLVTATRLELRSCILDYGELLRQAPNLRELVIDAGDFDEEQIPLPGAALPAGLMRLVLESIPLEKPAKWPAMPGAAAWNCCRCSCADQWELQLQPRVLPVAALNMKVSVPSPCQVWRISA